MSWLAIRVDLRFLGWRREGAKVAKVNAKVVTQSWRGRPARVFLKDARAGRPRYVLHMDAQGPGPPQRQHMPGAADWLDLPADSAPTAKTLSARAVLVEPHSGHSTSCGLVIDRTSFSKR